MTLPLSEDKYRCLDEERECRMLEGRAMSPLQKSIDQSLRNRLGIVLTLGRDLSCLNNHVIRGHTANQLDCHVIGELNGHWKSRRKCC